MNQLKLTQYLVASEPVADGREDGAVKRVVFGTRTSQARVLAEPLWSALQDGHFAEIPADILAELIQAEFLVPAAEDEAATILDANDEAAASEHFLYLVIQPTA